MHTTISLLDYCATLDYGWRGPSLRARDPSNQRETIVAEPHAVQCRVLCGGLVLLALLTGCAGGLGGLRAVSRELKPPSTALAAATDTGLARSIEPLAAAHPGRSGF